MFSYSFDNPIPTTPDLIAVTELQFPLFAFLSTIFHSAMQVKLGRISYSGYRMQHLMRERLDDARTPRIQVYEFQRVLIHKH